MTYEQNIRRARAEMSKSFSKLADFLLDSYVEASFMTASELAHALNLDAATVVRFSQALGYTGFPQLQREIREKVKTDLLVRPRQATVEDSIPGVAASSMQELITELDQTRISLNTDSLSQLVDMIGEARRIIVLADAPAQPAAYNLVYFLEQGGFLIFIARSGAVDLARTILTATPQDLVLSIDVAGQTPYIASTLSEAHARGIPSASIVGTASLASGRSADVVLSAHAQSSDSSGVVIISALIHVLVRALRWRFADRFSGAEQAIQDLYHHIHQPNPST
jgi:DNA-binding MurR/RpiR family transcriptional regulator